MSDIFSKAFLDAVFDHYGNKRGELERDARMAALPPEESMPMLMRRTTDARVTATTTNHPAAKDAMLRHRTDAGVIATTTKNHTNKNRATLADVAAAGPRASKGKRCATAKVKKSGSDEEEDDEEEEEANVLESSNKRIKVTKEKTDKGRPAKQKREICDVIFYNAVHIARSNFGLIKRFLPTYDIPENAIYIYIADVQVRISITGRKNSDKALLPALLLKGKISDIAYIANKEVKKKVLANLKKDCTEYCAAVESFLAQIKDPLTELKETRAALAAAQPLTSAL
ncbi:hypothetical protein LTR12_003996 [Friedmanniomyces endolithicus]|nr:hypothetical protein LTR74_007864 [Friedmanniomyces endolithicus]KAK1821602.1 hypothetical protein LTR12_003996 [Friedmanniomyces endolithicus]